jgi:hypothetical protein
MPEDVRNPNQETRIQALKDRAMELSHGKMIASDASGLPLDLQEDFSRRVVETEEGPTTTLTRELDVLGVPLPAPESLADAQLTSALWIVIDALSGLHVYLEQTDHLSERELYRLLIDELLPEEMDALGDGNWHMPILGGCSEADLQLYMKYYAKPEEREHWMRDVPHFAMPARAERPYDRDRHLPKAPY